MKLTLNSRVFAFIRRQIPLIFLDICAGKFSMSQVGDARIKLALALAALLILGQHVVCWTRNGVYGWYSDRGILLCVFGLTCRTHLSTFHDTTPLGFGEGRLTIVICAHFTDRLMFSEIPHNCLCLTLDLILTYGLFIADVVTSDTSFSDNKPVLFITLLSSLPSTIPS